ncbi:MAG: hypothetical protein QM674_09895 [Burkholderiaceae bacterium]
MRRRARAWIGAAALAVASASLAIAPARAADAGVNGSVHGGLNGGVNDGLNGASAKPAVDKRADEQGGAAAGAWWPDAADGRWQVWLNPGMYSRHFDRDLGLRENNTGIGAEVIAGREHGLLFGGYHNSNDAWTRYAGYLWRPLWWGEPRGLQAGLGVIVAAFDGYPDMRNGGWFIGALPVLAIEYGRIGANLTVVPGYKDRLHGAIAVQVRLRVW